MTPPPPPRRCTPQHAQRHGQQPVSGTADPGVVKQDKSSRGSVDTTKTRSGPQRVRMSSGKRPIGAAKSKQSDTEPPPPPRGLEPISAVHSVVLRASKEFICAHVNAVIPPPPLQTPGLARGGLPGGWGRWSPSDGLPGGRGWDCKGISRQTVVPSTDASKENTCEANFALMRCQCVSSNTNVIEDPKEW